MNYISNSGLSKIFLCCFGFSLYLTSPSVGQNNVNRNSSTESYEDYDPGDRHFLFHTYKTYDADEKLDKGIRKLDTSLESVEKMDNEKAIAINVTDQFSHVSSSTTENSNSVAGQQSTLSSLDRKDDEDDDDQSVFFEDSETDQTKRNISGTLVNQLVPEILKFDGRVVLPTADEQHNQFRPRQQLPDKSVVQKLPPRRVRQQLHNSVTSSPYYSHNMSRLEQIFDLYNPYRLLQIWHENEQLHRLSPKCLDQTQTYLLALRQGEPWAVKMWDASGHYSGAYFWGNQYWMGSRTLCREISMEEPKLPFPVGFSVARTNILVKALSVRKHGQNQFIGVCLPYVCNGNDVHILMQQSMISSEANDDREAEVIKIKSHYDHYYMVQDRTFWLVIISSTIVLFLLVCGTLLDLSIQKRRRQFLRNEVNPSYKYDNYTYAVNPPLQPYSDIKVDVEGCIPERPNSSGAETPPSEPEDPKYIAGVWQDVFLSFSAIRNSRQICDSNIGDGTIPIIHGLRPICMAWIILGHTCIVAFKYSDNMDFRKVVEREILFQTINNAAFTVDTFFFISGLLVTYLYFRTMAKVNVHKITKTTGLLSNCIEFTGLIVYRICRLTIPYIYALGLVELTMKWFHYNSVFDPPADDHVNCPNYWWRNLLYINTLFPVKDMCMLWSWYLADDTQFYILGVVLLIVAVRHFKAAATSVCVLMIISWCVTGYIAYLNHHMPNHDDPLAFFDKIYDKPWTRFGPYLVGMIVGWILYKTDCKIPMRKPYVILGWTISTVTMLSLVYGLYKTELHSITAAAYSSLSHTLWAAALSWIVIACASGHGGYVNTVLTCKFLIPFSRTTYCAYLIHPILIRWVVMRRDSPVHLAEETVAINFLGQFVASYILAFLLSITFEAPVVSLLKIVSPTKRRKHH